MPLDVVADAPVNWTVPKLAKGTSESPSSKSSTIHSAFSWHSAGWREKVCVIVWPERWFTSVAEPAVVEVAVTVAVIESPARTLKPVKSEALAGYHSNQAIMMHRTEDLKRIRSGKNGRFD